MDTQIEPEQKRLTIDDPVDAESRAKFVAIQDSRLRIGDRLMDIELERVKLIRSASALDNERQRLFERILIERGLSPNQRVSIDAETGQIRVLTQDELDNIKAAQRGAALSAD